FAHRQLPKKNPLRLRLAADGIGQPRVSNRGHEPRTDPFALESPVALARSMRPPTHQGTLIRMGTSHTSPAKPNSSGLTSINHLSSVSHYFSRTLWTLKLVRVECAAAARLQHYRNFCL